MIWNRIVKFQIDISKHFGVMLSIKKYFYYYEEAEQEHCNFCNSRTTLQFFTFALSLKKAQEFMKRIFCPEIIARVRDIKGDKKCDFCIIPI